MKKILIPAFSFVLGGAITFSTINLFSEDVILKVGSYEVSEKEALNELLERNPLYLDEKKKSVIITQNYKPSKEDILLEIEALKHQNNIETTKDLLTYLNISEMKLYSIAEEKAAKKLLIMDKAKLQEELLDGFLQLFNEEIYVDGMVFENKEQAEKALSEIKKTKLSLEEVVHKTYDNYFESFIWNDNLMSMDLGKDSSLIFPEKFIGSISDVMEIDNQFYLFEILQIENAEKPLKSLETIKKIALSQNIDSELLITHFVEQHDNN